MLLGILFRALLAGVCASIASGVMGSYVVVRGIAFLSGSISHAIFGGIGIATLFGLSPSFGAVVAAVLSAVFIAVVQERYRQRSDTLIATLWVVGVAVGIIALSYTPQGDLLNILCGHILWVSWEDITLLLLIDLFALLLMFAYRQQLLAISLDTTHALLQGLSIATFDALLLICVALTIVALVQVMGSLLVIALLTLPAAAAELWSRRLDEMIFLAVLISALSVIGGIGIAFFFNLPPSGAIGLLTAASYLLSVAMKGVKG